MTISSNVIKIHTSCRYCANFFVTLNLEQKKNVKIKHGLSCFMFSKDCKMEIVCVQYSQVISKNIKFFIEMN